MPARPGRRCRKSCKCWDGSAPTLPALLFETAPAPANLSLLFQEGISALQTGAAACLRLYKRLPFLRRPAFPGCGNGKTSVLATNRRHPFAANLRCPLFPSQRVPFHSAFGTSHLALRILHFVLCTFLRLYVCTSPQLRPFLHYLITSLLRFSLTSRLALKGESSLLRSSAPPSPV